MSSYRQIPRKRTLAKRSAAEGYLLLTKCWVIVMNETVRKVADSQSCSRRDKEQAHFNNHKHALCYAKAASFADRLLTRLAHGSIAEYHNLDPLDSFLRLLRTRHFLHRSLNGGGTAYSLHWPATLYRESNSNKMQN